MDSDLPRVVSNSKFRNIDKRMISQPSNFRHVAHIEPKTSEEIEKIKSSDNVLETVNETHDYIRPSSVTSTMNGNKDEKILFLDEEVKVEAKDQRDIQFRHYENKPTSHVYQNMISRMRPSPKKYHAPPPPPQEIKPKIILEENNESVVFRKQISDSRQIQIENVPEISTAFHIDPPKQYSVILERPDGLGLAIGLDDYIPVVESTPPMGTISPLMQSISNVISADKIIETPILRSSSIEDENPYMSMRSTSVQGRKILDDLDSWLDKLDEEEKNKLKTISTDESGYPTLVSKHDRDFMQNLIMKYDMDVEPETIKLPYKKNRAPIISSNPAYIPLSERPVSLLVHPNRPPPDYNSPSFEAPTLSKQAGRIFGKQNAFDLRSTVSSSTEYGPSVNVGPKRSSCPQSLPTLSSDLTDVSTTSSRDSERQSVDVVSVSEGLTKENKQEDNQSMDQFRGSDNTPVPVPRPRTKKPNISPIDSNKSIHDFNLSGKENEDNYDSDDEILITRF